MLMSNETQRFVDGFVRILRRTTPQLAAVYVEGSTVHGGYLDGVSDVDVVALVRGRLPDAHVLHLRLAAHRYERALAPAPHLDLAIVDLERAVTPLLAFKLAHATLVFGEPLLRETAGATIAELVPQMRASASDALERATSLLATARDPAERTHITRIASKSRLRVAFLDVTGESCASVGVIAMWRRLRRAGDRRVRADANEALRSYLHPPDEEPRRSNGRLKASTRAGPIR
jgi:predicted nucleotidyltransferase